MSDARLARGFWTVYESVHAVVYFAPEAQDAFAAAGLRGFWRGYFAGRCAPLGAVPAAPVTAIFNSFAPGMVERALPAVWSLISPEDALATRSAAAVAALRALAPQPSVEAARRVEELAAAAEPAGHPLGAANAAVPPTDDPYARVWQAVTTLREHRGDAHVAALATYGVAGLDILALRCLIDLDRARMQQVRGWTDEQWDAALAGLAERGLVEGGLVSARGHDVIAAVERATDERSVFGSEAQVRAAARALLPLARAAAALLPRPNPIGVPGVWDAAADPAAASVSFPPSS